MLKKSENDVINRYAIGVAINMLRGTRLMCGDTRVAQEIEDAIEHLEAVHKWMSEEVEK